MIHTNSCSTRFRYASATTVQQASDLSHDRGDRSKQDEASPSTRHRPRRRAALSSATTTRAAPKTCDEPSTLRAQLRSRRPPPATPAQTSEQQPKSTRSALFFFTLPSMGSFLMRGSEEVTNDSGPAIRRPTGKVCGMGSGGR